jgi:hypothetical protein
MNKDKTGTLEDLFKDEIKDPFFYKLNLNESKNNKELFEKIQNIYKTGLMILFGDELSKTINIKNLSYRHIDKINKYMLSIGIKVQYNRLTNFELNKLYESFLFELENIDEIDILVTKNWKLDEIISLNINIKEEIEDKDKIKNKISKILEKYPCINYLLKFKPICQLEDYAIIVKLSSEIHIINFKCANVADYSKPITIFNEFKINSI